MKRGKGIDPDSVGWRKSSYSNNDGGDCVEVATPLPGAVPVRDSKQADNGPVLLFHPTSWTAFVEGIGRRIP
ncbi:DUF397 domain-containing protein [Streptomyces alanosinicus]|uniref:DUF397 domain-containing protein n=1 Tax=Streptomyces alanosinicus TaxID=68171 RepID=A0A918YEW3_9ACTN|nr:DUF397 domain-containing protein [Streptomyces alanosinicus]GHE00411.1 hypothetical protein GCM10010339_15480 [Streptomyces alanosinicus]